MRRPRSVTLLALLVLLAAALGWSRSFQSVRLWDFILEGPFSVHPGYLLATGLVLAVVGTPLALALWFGKRWAWRGVQIFLGGLVLYYWLDRLLFGASETMQQNILFFAGLSVILALWAAWILTRPVVRQFFGVMEKPGELHDK